MDYDDKNRVISRDNFAGKTTHYTYNESDKGAVSQIQVEKNHILFNYGEDDNNMKGNLITQIARYDGAGEPSTDTEKNFYYGAFRNLTKTTHFSKPSGTIFNTKRHFNNRGQLESIANHAHKGQQPSIDSAIKYQYDSMNRLISEMHDEGHLIKSIDYSYDSNNNLIVETYHDGTNQQSVTHDYNAQDQRLRSTINNDNQQYLEHYSWNKNGHLEKAPDTTGFEYDTQGYLLAIKHPDFAAIDYHYLPNGLLSKRTRNQKTQTYYHGINKKITAIKNEDQWYSLVSDTHRLLANITDNSVDQFFVSGRDTGGILTNGKDFQTTTYTAYGRPVAPFKQSDIASSFGWNQEYLDQDANLTYLQRRFYHVDLKLFLSRDSYYVDNHYMYGKANPVTFIDPTGHNARQGVSYGLGGGMAVLGIIGAALAVPTGGASLTLSAGAGIVAGVSTSLSGISLMGSQAALDSGNKQAAKTLQYTSIGLSTVALIAAGVAIAPEIVPSFFASSEINFEESADFLDFVRTVRNTGSIHDTTGLAERMTSRAYSGLDPRIGAAITATISEHLTASGESQAAIEASAGSVSSASSDNISPAIELETSTTNALTETNALSPGTTSLSGAVEPDGALYTRAITFTSNSPVFSTTPTSEVTATPIISGAFATKSSVFADMTGANASLTSSPNFQDVPDLVAPWPGSYGY
jgi:RHS repeat-associated protein